MTRKTSKAEKRNGSKKLAANSAALFERLLQKPAFPDRYRLRLYVTGTTARSTRAVETVRALCEQFLPGKYDLEVVDIYQQPDEAIHAQIIAAPTLIKELPKPLKRLIGNLSDRHKLIAGLSLSIHE